MRPIHLAFSSLLLAAPLMASAAATDSTVVDTQLGSAAVMNTVDVSGTISAIDPKTREVTLSLSDDQSLTVTASPDVKNFDKLEVGQQVAMTFTRALALELQKGSDAPVARSDEGVMARAEQGEMPAGIAGHRVVVMAEVTALDPETNMVTLRGPSQSVDLHVPNAEQFANIAVGDRVEATYIEGMAVQVTPAEAAE